MFEMQHSTTPKELEEFKNWALEKDNSFFVKHRSKPPVSKLIPWIRRVDLAHEEARQLLGGKLIDVEVETNQGQSKANLDDHQGLINELMFECRDFFNHYGYKKDILEYPTIQKGDHSSQRVSKLISRFYKSNDYGYEKIDRIQRLVSRLGDMWNKYKTQKRKGVVTISTSPKGFILIGHYGPDKESCFREGSTSPKDKWVLSQTPNTVVVTYAEEIDGKWRNISRSLGMINPDNKSLHLSNCYFAKGVREGDLIDVYRIAWEKVTGKKIQYTEGRLKFSRERDKIYANEFGKWSFVQNVNDNQSCKVNKSPSNLYELYSNNCARTGKNFQNDKGFDFIDGMYCSPEAQEKAYTCVATGKRTFDPGYLKQILGPEGDAVFCHQDYFEDMPVCEETKQKCSSVCTTPEGKNICEYLFHERYEICDSLGEYFPKDEIVDLLGYGVSQFAIDQAIFPFDEEELEQINMVAQRMKESNHAEKS